MAESMMVYTAVYGGVDAALADLDALEQWHRDGVIAVVGVELRIDVAKVRADGIGRDAQNA